MDNQKLSICLILPDPVRPEMPARPAVMEIYGKYLPSFGHSITWITPSRDKADSTDRIAKEYGIEIFSVPYPYRNSSPGKIVGLFLYIYAKKKLIDHLCSEHNYNIIQVRNDIISALLALNIGQSRGIPVVFQYSFPKELYKYEGSKLSSQYYYKKLNRYLLMIVFDRVDLILPISKWMEYELTSSGISKSKMMPLPMGVNPDLFSENKTGTEIRAKYDIRDSKTLTYIGTMDLSRNLDIVLLAFSQIREKKEDIRLIMVGNGSDLARLKSKALALGLSNEVIFTGQVPYKHIPDYIAASDICLSPIPPTPQYLISSPTKLFEYMVMGKPVIANLEIPEHKEVIEESKAGILVPFTPEGFTRGITELLDSPRSLLNEMGKNGQTWVFKNRSYETLTRQVEKRYLDLLNRQG